MSDAVPPWAYEKPELHPHDPRWADRARTERAGLAKLLAPWLVDGVEHVGSTAVPGLVAKPVIDLMASVSDPDTVVDQAGERLAADGWCYVPPELDQRPWRRFFVKPDTFGRRRVAHLHVIRAGHPRWAEQLAFRDALRGDDQLAERYQDLKQRLTAQHANDREAYTDAKAEFVAGVLRRAAGPGAS
ncbi:MAG TPA: GrpB family protein [Trebonia sp.]